jgi:hypothetical protein
MSENEAEARKHVATAWSFVVGHVAEAFVGDTRGIATVLNAAQGIEGHPLTLEEHLFGDAPRVLLVGNRSPAPEAVYALLRAVAAKPDDLA